MAYDRGEDDNIEDTDDDNPQNYNHNDSVEPTGDDNPQSFVHDDD